MTKTAVFSNGYTDTYKGDRDVRAAWAIIRKSDGQVLNSGHSLDRARAQKTAEGNATYHGTDVLGAEHPMRSSHYVGRHAPGSYAEKSRMRRHNAERKALILAGVTIEVVDI